MSEANGMNFIVRNIGGLGYSAARKGGKAVRDFIMDRAANDRSTVAVYKSQQAAPVRFGRPSDGQRYDPTSSFVANNAVRVK